MSEWREVTSAELPERRMTQQTTGRLLQVANLCSERT